MLEKIVTDKVLCYAVRDGRLLVFRAPCARSGCRTR